MITKEETAMETQHFDVLIVGAGLSGIGAAYHLKANCPTKRYAILEGREAIGGTWDLFRYPGIRSDSDMYTLGYSFKPWTEAKAIADGPNILNYVRATAAENDIERHIRFNTQVKRASWSTADALWTVEAEQGPSKAIARFTCNFILMCSGYYNYAGGHAPEFPGMEAFAGRWVHPQAWPTDLDYAGKKVVVIGSGATAVTIVPEMAKTAASVTMLQRSPTYVVSRPGEDALANWLRAKLPGMLAYRIVRWRNVLLGMFFFNMARKKPDKVKQQLIGMVREHLGPDYDVDTHFTPRYNPWDQRLCLVPDSDLFEAIKGGRASVVTDHIDRITPDGIKLKGGQTLPADIIVSATGLKLQLLSGMEVTVDGQRADLSQAMSYKSMMFSDVPNLISVFGYTNASWTLKADLTSEYACRLINYMDRKGYAQSTPRKHAAVGVAQWMDFSSGYVTRSMAEFPKQADKHPWKLYQNYVLDVLTLRFGKVDDGTMEFRKAPAKAAVKPVRELIAAE